MPKYEVKIQIKEPKKDKFVNKVLVIFAETAEAALVETKRQNKTKKIKKIISCERLE